MTTVLSNNLSIFGTPFWENTVKIIPPGAGSSTGKIVVVTGTPASILTRPLFNSGNTIDFSSATTQHAIPTGAEQSVGTDNQIVRLNDGSLLAAKNGSLWNAVSPAPVWSNETILGHKGLRGGELFFRSTDGGDNWAFHSAVDYATVAGGNYAYPRPMSQDGTPDVPVAQQGKNPDGSLMWWMGGGDRDELYACPFTGFLYMTSRVISGPYKDVAPHRDAFALLYSMDGGETWISIKEDFPSSEPLVMTSTPNGRLFLFQCIGSQPTIYFSIAPVNGASKPTISPGYPVFYHDNGVDVPCASDGTTVLHGNVGTPSISRISLGTGSSKIRVSYQAVNANGRQDARIIKIDVQDPNRAPVVSPVMTVEAENTKEDSVTFFTFIDPDYLSMPSGVRSNTSLGFWLESPGQSVTKKQFRAKYLLLEDDDYFSNPGYLSVKDGQPWTWSDTIEIGDYIVGGFFWKDNGLNYLAHWSEVDGLKANVVSFSYKAPQHLVRGWLLADFEKKYDIMGGDSYRLALVQRYDIGGGQIRYNGVFNRSDLPQQVVYGWTLDDFKGKYTDLMAQGFRLSSMQRYDIGNGQIRYDGIWNPSDASQQVVYGWTLDDFKGKYTDLMAQGFRLSSMQRYDIGNGQIRYDGIWNPSDASQQVVYGWTLDDFKGKYTDLMAQGFRLSSMQRYDIGNGQIRYDGIWNPSDASQEVVYGWTNADFYNKHRQLYMSGYRVVGMQAYDIGNGQIRYDAIWNLI